MCHSQKFFLFFIWAVTLFLHYMPCQNSFSWTVYTFCPLCVIIRSHVTLNHDSSLPVYVIIKSHSHLSGKYFLTLCHCQNSCYMNCNSCISLCVIIKSSFTWTVSLVFLSQRFAINYFELLNKICSPDDIKLDNLHILDIRNIRCYRMTTEAVI